MGKRWTKEEDAEICEILHQCGRAAEATEEFTKRHLDRSHNTTKIRVYKLAREHRIPTGRPTIYGAPPEYDDIGKAARRMAAQIWKEMDTLEQRMGKGTGISEGNGTAI